MGTQEARAGKVLLVGAGLLLAYSTGRVLMPLAGVLAASAIVAVVTHPLYARLLARAPDRPNAASALTTVFVCVLVAGPLIIGGWYAISESMRAYPLLKEWVQSPSGPVESIPSWVPWSVRSYLEDLNLKNFLTENIQEIGTWSGRFLRAAAGNAAALALNLIVFVITLFLLLRDGRKVLGRLMAAMPLAARSKARIVERAHDMISATIQGVFAVALLQGILSIAGFAVFGVGFPVILGLLCMVFSPIPIIGTAVVWIPVVARIALGGELGRAAAVALWFALVVGMLDNVLRPVLIGSRSRLPAAIVVVGVLGGVKAFGVIGTFVGPVIMAIAAAVFDTVFLSNDQEDSST